MAISQPHVRSLDAADVRLGSIGAKTGPALRGLDGGERREQVRRAPMNLLARLRVDLGVESGVFFGGSGDGESVRALKNIGVAAAQHCAEKAGLEIESDQMTFDRLYRRHRD